MALLHLAAPLARDGAAEVSVATVDHGLRAASKAEAAMVASSARALGLAHATLVWTGVKPSSGVQEAARNARYHLLAVHAEKIGAGAIMTAHTADDQAETVLMRLARGSGPRGLSAMAEESLIAAGAGAPLRLLRPVLAQRRDALRAYLRDAGAAYVDDPGNDDDAYERVRVRRLLANMESAGALSVAKLIETADACRKAALRLEAAENDRFRSLDGAFSALGAASLSAAVTMDDAPLVARLVHAVGGARHQPAEQAAEEAIRRLQSGSASTLGGATLTISRRRLTIVRESAALMGRAGVSPLARVALAPGECALWDGRFAVTNAFATMAEIGPVGAAAASHAASDEEAQALSVAPALWVNGKVAAITGECEAICPLADERFYRRVNRFMRIT